MRKHGPFDIIFILSLFFLLASIALSGCAEGWPSVMGAAVDGAGCIGSDYPIVQRAFTEGIDATSPDAAKAADWLGVISLLSHCVPTVIRDLETPRNAFAGPGVLPSLTLDARRRIRFAKRLFGLR